MLQAQPFQFCVTNYQIKRTYILKTLSFPSWWCLNCTAFVNWNIQLCTSTKTHTHTHIKVGLHRHSGVTYCGSAVWLWVWWHFILWQQIVNGVNDIRDTQRFDEMGNLFCNICRFHPSFLVKTTISRLAFDTSTRLQTNIKKVYVYML